MQALQKPSMDIFNDGLNSTVMFLMSRDWLPL